MDVGVSEITEPLPPEDAGDGETQQEIPGLTRPRLRSRSSNMIGDVAIQLGFAEKERIDAAIEQARVEGKRTGQVLVETGVLSNDQLSRVLAERLGLDHVDLATFPIDMGAVGLIEIEAARRYQAVPIMYLPDRRLLLAMSDPSNLLTIDDITMMTGLKVQPAVSSLDDIRSLLARQQSLTESVEGIDESEDAALEPLTEDADAEAPAIRLVHSLIAQAVTQGASDIHFDPEEREMKVLFRVDGVIHPAATMSAKMARRVVSRVKVMASLNIAERRLPQDGRMAVNVDGRRIDLRIVTLPLSDGEGIVMRVLDKGPVVQDLAGLGMLPQEEEKFRAALKRHRGAVLVTGPTGSGKSTTLYAAVNEVNTGEGSIITIEDPVESRIAGVKQMAVNTKVGMTFATGLRTMLRADPDIIMVGEIRDEETATIAVQAAITGHMVLSTLHTNNAPSALGRLNDMGVPPFMIASAVDCVVAQRLLRRLCEDCKQPVELAPDVVQQWDLQGVTAFGPKGCARCGNTGYRGRVGVFEVMTMSEEIRRMAMQNGSADDITHQAVSEGMRSMRADGIDKVKAGVTSIVELGRVTSLV
jgi:type IV pilus assembly protein PilB